MADNTIINTGTGGDTIATDELTSLNGGVVSGFKVQRVKVGFGSDASLRDVDAANGLPVTGTFFQATQPVSLATNTPVLAAGTNLIGKVAIDQTTSGTTNLVALISAPLVISTTGIASAGVTATLPAVVGQFHYITRVNIVKYASVATVGAAAPTVVTTTNLAGSLAFTTPTAIAVGTQYENDIEPTSPIKSSATNTATTIVCPATTSIIWRVNVYYYTAA